MTRKFTTEMPHWIRRPLPGPVLRHVWLLLATASVLLPILITFLISTQTPAQVYDIRNVFPGGDAVDNYRTVLTRFRMGGYLVNTLVLSAIIVVGKISLSLLAALAIVYYQFRFKNLVFLFILFTLMFPVPVRIVPLFQLVADFGWTNTIAGVAGPYVASATAVFLLRQHFRSLPNWYVETALLDGVGPLRFLVSVLIPASRGYIVGLVVITFIASWNYYLWPLIVINDRSQQVAQVGLKYLLGVGTGQTDWGLIMAGAFLTLLPPLVVLVAFRRPLLETFGLEGTS